MRVSKAQVVQGYLPGVGQPTILLSLEVDPITDPDQLHRFEQAIGLDSEELERLEPLQNQPTLALVERFRAAVCHRLRLYGFPVFSSGVLLDSRCDLGLFKLALPSNGCGPQATALAAKSVLESFAQSRHPHPHTDAETQILRELKTLAARIAPKGMNTLRFLQAAFDLSIPTQWVAGNVYQFGWGASARWLDSSFTDQTAQISAILVRDKVKCAQVLHSAGLPVPQHALARSQEEAVTVAAKLGFPVVVKPANLDGGLGVSADLRNEQAVRKAFDKARALSTEILVEKHCQGEDYRIHVFRDQAYWVAHRQPGGVTGDGRHSVSQLLALLNSDPLRGPVGSSALLKRIELDEEALDLLSEQSFSADDIPQAGTFVRLRRAANVASGGVPVPVLETAHPDNLALAVRAARVLRLDLAGVDLLIPDIRRSWLESGAGICEVNAQPQLSPTLHRYLLQRLVRHQGRIPTIMVLGDLSQAPWLPLLASGLKSSDRCLGLVTPEGVYVDSDVIMPKGSQPFAAATALLKDPRVEVFMLCSDEDTWLETGFPIDQVDVLILLAPLPQQRAHSRWQALGQMGVQICQGVVFMSADESQCLGAMESPLAAKLKPLVPTTVVSEVLTHIEAIDL